MKKIIEFKSRKKQFKENLKELINSDIENALVVYADKNNAYITTYNLDIEDLKYYRSMIDKKIRNLEFDEFLREHLHEYVEF